MTYADAYVHPSQHRKICAASLIARIVDTACPLLSQTGIHFFFDSLLFYLPD